MNALLVVVAFVVLGIGYVVLANFLAAYISLGGSRVVRCPEEQRTALIALDVWRSARNAAIGRKRVYVANCSRWPQRRKCNRGCLQDITTAMAQSQDLLIRPEED
jgi:hypothetical protein